MLAQLPLPYPLLMAGFATLALCLYVDRWLKIRKMTTVFLVASVACCIGMIIVGGLQYQHWNPKQMLVIYSFSWIGILVGLLPIRKPYREYLDEIDRGIKREKYEYQKWRVMMPAVSISATSILGFLLAT